MGSEQALKGSEAGSIATLLPWLHWLDARLRAALDAGRAEHGSSAYSDPYRGLYITPADVDQLLGQAPGQPLFAGLGPAEFPTHLFMPPAFQRLAQAAGLTPFDGAVVLLALAPELDLRYERLYAYLQDDVNRKRPTVDLALNLLTGDAAEKLALRSRFLADAPLLRHGLITLSSDTAAAPPPLLAQGLRLDPQVVAAFLGADTMDARLLPSCRLVSTSPPPSPATGLLARLEKVSRQAMESGVGACFHFHGPDALARQQAAASLAGALGRPLLQVDLARLVDNGAEVDAVLAAVRREALLREAVVCLEDFDVLAESAHVGARHAVLASLQEGSLITILSGDIVQRFDAGHGAHVASVAFDPPEFPGRLTAWRHELAHHGLPDETADVLAARFQLTTGQIRNAAHAAAAGAALQAAGGNQPPGLRELLTTAGLQTRDRLAGLAQHIESTRTWGDLVLPAEPLAQLREICARFRQRERVLTDWGFARKLGYGIGTNVLFAGPSGTGKTMAAGIMAGELGLDLFRIDLASVVSKYIGETIKNLEKIFKAPNAILFFDEADALFGKRSEVKDAHDRYANQEVSYLLQKMEEYEGIAILATNLRQNLDEAFIRRLAFIVQFPFPDEDQRQRIWAGVWPKEVPLAEDVDLSEFAAELKLSGGGIRNVALAAAFLAADEGVDVGRTHLSEAARREFQKEGKKLGRPSGVPI